MKTPTKLIVLSLALFCSVFNNVEGNTTPNGEKIERKKGRDEIEDFYSGKTYLSRSGKNEAEIDIAKGCPKYKDYGRELGEPYKHARDEVFKERLGIHREQIAGCFVNDPMISYAKEYNARILKYVAEKFGKNAWQDANAEAIRRIDDLRKEQKG